MDTAKENPLLIWLKIDLTDECRAFQLVYKHPHGMISKKVNQLAYYFWGEDHACT